MSKAKSKPKPSSKAKQAGKPKAKLRPRSSRLEKVELRVPCKFLGQSAGDQTARLGVQIEREHLSPEVADALFTGHRLEVELRAYRPGDDPKQTKMFDEHNPIMKAVADSKGTALKPSYIGIGLTFNKEDVKDSILQFAKRSGELTVVRAVELVQDDSPANTVDEPLPGQALLPCVEA